MGDKPIPLTGPEVSAILRGIERPGTGKTQTRRVLKPQPFGDVIHYGWSKEEGAFWTDQSFNSHRLRIWAGDRLWVREAWAKTPIAPIVESIDNPITVYRDGDARCDYGGPWKPSIHMKRRDSRITLTVTDVRVQRLQNISSADAIAEGVRPSANSLSIDCDTPDPREGFRSLWDSINAKRGLGWDSNPWVAAYTFTPKLGNIDHG